MSVLVSTRIMVAFDGAPEKVWSELDEVSAENVARAYFHVSSDQRHKEFITSEGNYETVKRRK